MKIIEKEGVGALTLREVARRLGVSQSAPYHHFADKEAILAAVAEEGFLKLCASMEDASATAGSSARAMLRASGLGYVRFATRHLSHFQVMFTAKLDPTRYPSLHVAANRAFELLVGGVVAAQAEGAIRPGDPQELAMLSWSMVHGVAMLHVAGMLGDPCCGAYDSERLAESAVETMMLGLRPA